MNRLRITSACITVFAVIVALAVTMLGIAPAQAHTTTAVLFPDGQGTDTTWADTESEIDETGTPNCSDGDSVRSNTGGQRESVNISLGGVPDGATITSVDVQAYQRAEFEGSGTIKTFQTFTRFNGTLLDSGVNILVMSATCELATQTLNVADAVKSGATTLEVGVRATSSNPDLIFVGAVRATVTYNTGPSAPTLVSPADVATTPDRTPTFDWEDDSADSPIGGTTADLLPVADGAYTAWTGDVGDVSDSDTSDCSSGETVITDTTNARESFTVDLASVPTGGTITSVDVSAWHRVNPGSAVGGTFQTFARLNGVDTDSGTNIVTVTDTGNCVGPATHTLDVADAVKAGGTTLEIGVLKTGTNTATVRVGALHAVVTYTNPPSTEGPFTYEIGRAPSVADACDWGNATIDAISSSMLTPGSDMSVGDHCWRVRALDHAGLAGPWSNHRTLTIEGEPVTAVITAADKAYDGDTDASYACDVVDEAEGDDVTCDGTHPGTFDTAGAGTGKTVTATGLALSGGDAGNYTLTSTSDTDEADIAKVELSVGADDKSKDFGDADPTFTYSLSGFVNSEDDASANVTGAAACTRDAGETVAGSPYEITCAPGTLAAANYSFAAGETGELTIGAVNAAPTVTINQASGQSDPSSAIPILFTVTFSESVTGFAGSDVDLSGSAGATTALVSGSGATYTVSVSGMTTNGTVAATVPAGGATDGTNTSVASTSTDNTVTFTKPTCSGVTATIVGTSSSQSINGTSGNDVIDAGAGNDTINGGGGSDRICGGDGNDSLFGGAGNDALYGGSGNDTLGGEDGADLLAGGTGADKLSGGAGAGDLVNYTVDHSSGVNANIGNDARDDGNSTDGPSGARDIIFATVEGLQGTAGNDVLGGNGSANLLDGRGGNDRLFGSGGNDRLIGGTGVDTFYGGANNDTLIAKDGVKDFRIDGGTGTDSATRDSVDPASISVP